MLDQKIDENVEYARGKRKTIENKRFNVVSTELVNFNDSNGISRLKAYLGIDDKDNLLFDKYNLLVEGEEDKTYLLKLMTHFNIEVPNIISCNGANNITKYLEFYESMAEKSNKNKFVVILDNDEKGRDVFRQINPSKYKNIKVEKKHIITYSGHEPRKDLNGNCNANIEVEDFIKPEILCHLVNELLESKNLKQFSISDIKEISRNIKKPAFQNNGILALLENKKNELNPDYGQVITISGSAIKGGMANLFNRLDSEIIALIGDIDDENNSHILNFLNDISGEVKDTLF